MSRIIGVVNALWARNGPRIFVHNVGEGEFLLRVTNSNTRQFLLSRTCWNVAGFPMFVAPWSPDFTPDEAPITQAVLPVELRNVPYLLFNRESLSRLATAVGKPVSLYPETERKENFKIAKLYVRVDLTKPLPRQIISGYSNGKETLIEVTYPWLPLKCERCKKYGHLQEKCKAVSPNSERKRSTSPGVGRNYRRTPRKDHTKEPPKSNAPSDSEKITEVEEGELLEDSQVRVDSDGAIPQDQQGSETPSSQNDVARVREESPGGSALGAGENVIGGNNIIGSGKQWMNQDQKCSNANRSGRSHQGPGDPFFLVNNGKSGRKAKNPL